MDPCFVQTPSLRIGYLEAGTSGPLALLLHGFPDTPYGFRMLVPALVEAGYHVVAPFLRGYGPTEVPQHDATLEVLADDALALMGALGEERALVVGHDWGAAIAYLLAARNPAYVERLVVVGLPHPSTIRPSLRLLWQARHFIALRFPWAARSVQGAGVERFYRRWSPTWAFDESEVAAVKRCFADSSSANAAVGYYRARDRRATLELLRPSISAPTLAVGGLDDPALELSAYEDARRKFTGPYKVVGFPGGHFVHRESPDAFREAVVAFARLNAIDEAGG